MTTALPSWSYDSLYIEQTHRKSMDGQVPPASFGQMELDSVIPLFDSFATSNNNTNAVDSQQHTVASPSHRSRSSSPYSSSNASLPLVEHEPVWLECTTEEEINAGDHSESESSATSIHAHDSHASTPHLDQQQQHQMMYTHQHVSSPTPIIGHMLMPTIQELQRPQAIKSQQDELQLPELLLPASASHVGMLLPSPTMAGMVADDSMMVSASASSSSSTASVSSPTQDRIQVRARRRTRYTTAADQSVAARASCPNMPLSAPTLVAQVSHDSNTQSMDLTSTGSAHSSEHDEDEDYNNDQDDLFVDTTISPGKQAAKRKRGSKAASAAAANDADEACMNGLDKKERNKLSASMYRKRRKVYLDSLESKVGELDQTIATQSETIQRQAQENKALKEQLSFMKKMMASLKNPLSSSSAEGDAAQPTNIHHGARRAFSSSAGAFLFLILALCLAFNPFSGDETMSMEVGRRGRSLLSFEEKVSSFAPVASSIAGSAPSMFKESLVASVAEMMATPDSLQAASESAMEEDASSSVKSLAPLLELVSRHLSPSALSELASTVKSKINSTLDQLTPDSAPNTQPPSSTPETTNVRQI